MGGGIGVRLTGLWFVASLVGAITLFVMGADSVLFAVAAGNVLVAQLLFSVVVARRREGKRGRWAASYEATLASDLLATQIRDGVDRAVRDLCTARPLARVHSSAEGEVVLRRGANFLTWGDRITVAFGPGWIRVESRCSFPFQLFDSGSNWRTVREITRLLRAELPGTSLRHFGSHNVGRRFGALLAIGFALQWSALALDQGIVFTSPLLLLGTMFMLTAAAVCAESKGYLSWWWALGLLSIPGLAVLALLPERRMEPELTEVFE